MAPESSHEIRAVISRFREAVSGFAAVEEERPTPRLVSLRVQPFNPRAAGIALIVSEREVMVHVGEGGRFELGTGPGDRTLLEQLLEATLRGRVSEDLTFRQVAFRAQLAGGHELSSVDRRLSLRRRETRQYESWGTFSH
jgi:hypothetical protein